MKRIVFLGLVLFLMLPLAARAGPVTWLGDPFTDGGRTNGADALDSAWYFTNGPTVGVGAETILPGNTPTGNALSLTTTSTSTTIFRRLAGEFTAQSLANVGDSITLSVDFRMTTLGTTGNTNRGFKVGLFNNNGTSLTADVATTAEATITSLSDDKGYFVGIGTGTTGTTAIMKENGLAASFMAGTDIDYLTPSGGLSPQIGDLLAHSLVLTITKDTAGTLKVDFTLDGGAVDLTSGGGTTLVTSFNEVGFSNGAYQTGFVIDNINVTTIPEPATMSILALGALMLQRLRRQR